MGKKKRDREVALTKFGDLFPSTKKSASESRNDSIAIRSALITCKSRKLLFQISQQSNLRNFPSFFHANHVAHAQRHLVDTSVLTTLFPDKSLYINKKYTLQRSLWHQQWFIVEIGTSRL